MTSFACVCAVDTSSNASGTSPAFVLHCESWYAERCPFQRCGSILWHRIPPHTHITPRISERVPCPRGALNELKSLVPFFFYLKEALCNANECTKWLKMLKLSNLPSKMKYIITKDRFDLKVGQITKIDNPWKTHKNETGYAQEMYRRCENGYFSSFLQKQWHAHSQKFNFARNRTQVLHWRELKIHG